MKRREFLAAISLPFFRPRHISMAGARFRIIRNGRSKRRYLLIHGNEETAREVLVAHMRTQEGVAYVVESHTRNVPVAGLQVDPNRMFSRVGAEASLKRLNRDVAEGPLVHALHELDQDREHLLRELTPPKGGITIALHNNSSGYSVEQEVPISDEKSLREPANPHAFFLCTDPRDYAKLIESPYNVVLQHKSPPTDDGSLSRQAAARGFRYVNLEVEIGHPDRQLEMLRWVEWKL